MLWRGITIQGNVVVGELLAGVLVGLGVAAGGASVAVATGIVPLRILVRVLERLVPHDERHERRRLEEHDVFDGYHERQRLLARRFSEQVERLARDHHDYDIVVAVNRLEVSLLSSMPEIQHGKLYGRFEVLTWNIQACQVVTSKDRRLPRVAAGNGNGKLVGL